VPAPLTVLKPDRKAVRIRLTNSDEPETSHGNSGYRCTSSAKEKDIQLACQLFSAAVFNSSTNTVASISYLDEGQ